MVAYPLRPTSRGEINIESTDVNAMPVLKPNHHATAHDRELMIAIVRSARQYAAQPALRELIEIETRSEEHTSELQSLMRNSYAVFCLKKKSQTDPITQASYVTPHTAI